ncbi:hypothetical protein V490_01638 [Pseudogymnoascus sp. VKM F-3557]|nr:hypothetical protein V490_01638 [Pseudogymnoascus sp. VKM F-3557]
MFDAAAALKMEEDPDVQSALALISNLPLSPPEHWLLRCFVRDAVDSKGAALYVLERAAHDSGDKTHAETELRSLLEDWKQLVERFRSPTRVSAVTESLVVARDRGVCCITERSRVWWDVFGWSRPLPIRLVPPEVIAGFGDPFCASLREILTVFLTESGLDQLTDWLKASPNGLSQLRNTWTLVGDAAAAFRAGRVQILRDWVSGNKSYDLELNTCEYVLSYGIVRPFAAITNNKGQSIRSLESVVISTRDPQTMPLPSAFLFDIHSRFCNSLHWLQIQGEMQRGRPKNTFLHSCKATFRRMINRAIPALRHAWLCFPLRARELTYQFLLNVGVRIYGKMIPVQRAPFGLYIKHSPRKVLPRNEGSALRLVEQYTDVSAPQLIESLITKSRTYVVMTRPPGATLHDTINTLSYAERSQLAADVRACISQFRKIPNFNSAAICSANGGPPLDYRITDPSGPFDSEESFNSHIISQSSLRSAIHDWRHDILFSHADLNPINILIERGRLSGIVDSSCAGFYPEYWEYTKGLYGHLGLDRSWLDILSDVFEGKYGDELAAEQLLWENEDPF